MQVSIWAGEIIPDNRPEGWACAASTVASASSIAARPPSVSHSYSTICPFPVNQRAERYMGATTPRRPEAASVSIQPSQVTDKSASVVTPDFSNSE